MKDSLSLVANKVSEAMDMWSGHDRRKRGSKSSTREHDLQLMVSCHATDRVRYKYLDIGPACDKYNFIEPWVNQ